MERTKAEMSYLFAVKEVSQGTWGSFFVIVQYFASDIDKNCRKLLEQFASLL